MSAIGGEAAVLPHEKWTYRPMYKAKVLQPPRPEDVAEAAKILANAKPEVALTPAEVRL
jgi:acetolactate synthase I/II/III large subunit